MVFWVMSCLRVVKRLSDFFLCFFCSPHLQTVVEDVLRSLTVFCSLGEWPTMSNSVLASEAAEHVQVCEWCRFLTLTQYGPARAECIDGPCKLIESFHHLYPLEIILYSQQDSIGKS